MKNTQICRATGKEDVPWNLLLDADASKEAVGSYLTRGELWLAKLNGKVIGEMVLLLTRPRTLEIMNIAVTSRMRGKGVGTLLLQKAAARAKALGAGKLVVGTGNNSFPQLAFYQRFGFRIVGIRRDFFVKRYAKVYRRDGVALMDMIRMEKPLGLSRAKKETSAKG